MFPREGNGLLGRALNSLRMDKPTRNFATNKSVIISLQVHGHTNSIVGSLKVNSSNLNGESPYPFGEPLVSGDGFEIDLSSITLPTKMGGQTLQTLIMQYCQQLAIHIPNPAMVATASFTPVVTALPGQHAKEDVDCLDVTMAEFVPVFHANDTDKRVLALSYSVNGETGLRLDHMFVPADRSMPCIGREAATSTSLRATEIPNLLAKEMQEHNPEMFRQLQENAVVVVFVEYDLGQEVKQVNRNEPVYRGSSGVSAYSVIGQGSQTQDHSTRNKETGTKTLQNISVYVIGAMVVNTNGLEFDRDKASNLAGLMQLRAQELGRQYKPHERYTSKQFYDEMNNHLRQYNVEVRCCSIIAHSILSLAGLETEDFPAKCQCKEVKNSTDIIMAFGLPVPAVEKIVATLQRKFGSNFCRLSPEDNAFDNSTIAIRTNLSALKKIINGIKQTIDTILISPRCLSAYQKYSNKQYSYDLICNRFAEIAREFDVGLEKSDIVEITLLKMFACNEELRAAMFGPGPNYVGKILDTHFYLAISESAAIELVRKINQQYTMEFGQAYFVRSGVRVDQKPNFDLCEIVIPSDLLLDPRFLAHFKETATRLAEEAPFVMDDLRIQAGVQENKAEEHAKELLRIAMKYRVSDKDAPTLRTAKEALAEALKILSIIIAVPKCKQSQRMAADDRLRRALAFFESTQTRDENDQFKIGDKAKIKQIEKDLHLRKKMQRHR